MFEIFDLSVPLTLAVFIKTIVILFAVTVANYFMLTLPAYYYFKKHSGTDAVRLQEGKPFKGQVRHEIQWSMVTMFLYAILSTCMIVAWRFGMFPNFYVDPFEHGWFYLLFSVVLVLLVQDAYFYFAHRLLHTRKLIRFHGIHHRSKVPTPFVMYCFHPVEALVHFVRIPIMLMLFPVCPWVLFLTEGFISNVINAYSHTNHEPRFLRHIQKLHGWTSATSVYHDLHHAKVRGNYGFYLKIWDRLFNTMIPETETRIAYVHQQWQTSGEQTARGTHVDHA